MVNTDTFIIYIIIAILILLLLSVFSKKIGYILKFLIRSAVGVLGFTFVNMATSSLGVVVGANLLTILFVGLLGIPGFVSLYIFQFLFLWIFSKLMSIIILYLGKRLNFNWVP